MEFSPVLKPYAHQQVALEKLAHQEAYALLMDMRTGKTKVTIDDWCSTVVRGEADRLLIIAPTGVYKTWLSELDKHLPEQWKISVVIGYWESGRGVQVVGSPSSKRDQPRVLSDFVGGTGSKVLVVNIEALSSVKAARAACADFLTGGTDRKGSYVAVDESTTIKNPSTNRTEEVIKLGKLAKIRRILSGLPAPRSPLDLYSQFEFLDPAILGHRSFYSFRARYAVMRELRVGVRTVKIPVGFQNLEELTQKVQRKSYRVRLEDCYDLPKSNYSIREVLLTEEQVRIYRELRDFATSELAEEKHVTAPQVITQILRMHQVLCGHSRDEEGNWYDIPENRTKEVLSILEEWSGKAIIWCSYDHDIRKVHRAIEHAFHPKRHEPGFVDRMIAENRWQDYCCARFWGSNIATREDEEKLFKTSDACRYMISTPSAGGRGRTWDIANLVMYYSTTNDLDLREQSEKRPLGVGKKTPIVYVDLVSPGTVEVKILQALRKKINIASAINGDNYKEWII